MSGDLQRLDQRVQTALEAIRILLLEIVQPTWNYAVQNIHRKYKLPCGPSDTKPVLSCMYSILCRVDNHFCMFLYRADISRFPGSPHSTEIQAI